MDENLDLSDRLPQFFSHLEEMNAIFKKFHIDTSEAIIVPTVPHDIQLVCFTQDEELWLQKRLSGMLVKNS